MSTVESTRSPSCEWLHYKGTKKIRHKQIYFIRWNEKKVVSLYMMNYLLSYFGVGLYAPREMKTMSKKEINRVVTLTLWYCHYVLGTNSRKPMPKVKFFPTCEDGNYYGQYCPYDNEIQIFTDNVWKLGMLTSVIIHEYTHYLQPIKSKYYKLLKEHGYDNHPFEIEARDNERVHNRRALHYIRQNF